MFMGQQPVKSDSLAVIAPVDMEIPGRTVQLIHGELQGEGDSFCEALVEPTSAWYTAHESVYCTNAYPSFSQEKKLFYR